MIGASAPLGARVRTGILNGLTFAAVFSLVAAAVVMLRGHEAFVHRFHVTITQLVVVYFLGGAFSGAMVGAAWPLSRWQWGSFLLGFVALFPVNFAVAYLIIGPGEWVPRIILATIAAAVVGGGIGLVAYGDAHK